VSGPAAGAIVNPVSQMELASLHRLRLAVRFGLEPYEELFADVVAWLATGRPRHFPTLTHASDVETKALMRLRRFDLPHPIETHTKDTPYTLFGPTRTYLGERLSKLRPTPELEGRDIRAIYDAILEGFNSLSHTLAERGTSLKTLVPRERNQRLMTLLDRHLRVLD
jgi:hypothetical protein